MKKLWIKATEEWSKARANRDERIGGGLPQADSRVSLAHYRHLEVKVMIHRNELLLVLVMVRGKTRYLRHLMIPPLRVSPFRVTFVQFQTSEMNELPIKIKSDIDKELCIPILKALKNWPGPSSLCLRFSWLFNFIYKYIIIILRRCQTQHF